ncbi:MAG: hypothetical protein IGS48_11110 [Oscillatoriales cyanobacterium C42_A2020_001]|nr:hypothetical protein [Leptolyngbyaceae cyanobacterium C42_A2020_001]
MGFSIRWSAIPFALAIATVGIKPALSQPIMISPSSQPIQVSGMSGGNQKDSNCAGFVAPMPNHIVQVTEDTDLRFVLQGATSSALLIRSSTGQKFCVPADSYSQGKIEIPGRWVKGTYSVFVGDRANENHSYTLLISRSQ